MSAASGDEYLVADSAALAAAPESATRRVPPSAAQWPFLIVAVVAAGGLLLVVVGDLQRGLAGLAIAMGVAALLRLVLPVSTAGWLVSRSRVVDACGFACLAAALAAITMTLAA